VFQPVVVTDRSSGRPRGVRVDSRHLRALRTERGLTRADLEAQSNVTSRTIARAENTGTCSIDTLRRLSRALDVPYERLWLPRPDEIRQRLIGRGLSPPRPPRGWVGRERVCAELETLLTEEPACAVCLEGPTGIGKTATARVLADQLAEAFPDGVIWVRAAFGRGAPPPRSVQRTIADVYGFATQLPSGEGIDPESFDRAFQHQLWQRECLLVLDDVDYAPSVAHFASDAVPAHCIVTTHFRDVASALPHRIEVVGLPDTRARELLETYIDAARLEDDAAGTARLLEVLDGVPRSLHIAGAVLAREPLTTPGAYASRIESDASAHTLLGKREHADPWARRQQTQVAAYQQVRRHVSSSAFELFTRLGLFGQTPFPVSWAAAAAGHTLDETRAELGELSNLYLVEIHQDGRGQRVQLDAHAAWFANTRRSDTRLAIARRLAGYAIEALETALPAGLTHAWKGFDRSCWRILMTELLELGLGETDAETWKDPEDVPELEVSDEARLLLDAAQAVCPLVQTFPLVEAHPWMVGAFAVARSLGEPAGELALVIGRWWQKHRGDLERSERWVREAARVADALYARTQALFGVGNFSAMSGAHESAAVWYRPAVDESRASDAPPSYLASVICNLAMSTSDRGESPGGERLELLEEAHALASDLDGPVIPHIDAVTGANRAIVAHRCGADDASVLEDALAQMHACFRRKTLRARLVATALAFEVSPGASAFPSVDPNTLEGLWSAAVAEALERGHAKDIYTLGEFVLYTRRHLTMPPEEQFLWRRSGLYPTVVSYDPVPDIGFVVMPLLYALEPLIEVTSPRQWREIQDAYLRVHGPTHHVCGDVDVILERLDEGAGSS